MNQSTYELEFDITNLIRQFLRTSTAAASGGTHAGTTPPMAPMDASGARNMNTYLSMMQHNQNIIVELMYSYNTQMQRYNTNVEQLIQLLQTIQTGINQYIVSSSSEPVHPIPLYSPLRRNAIREDGNLIRTMLNNSLYNRPTIYTYLYPRETQHRRNTVSTEQINIAIQNVSYDTHSMIDTVCPISLLPFTDGEQVSQIKHCRHIFKQDSLNNWFTNYSTCCPVCRYDIRNYSESNTNNNRANSSTRTHESFDYDSDDGTDAV